MACECFIRVVYRDSLPPPSLPRGALNGIEGCLCPSHAPKPRGQGSERKEDARMSDVKLKGRKIVYRYKWDKHDLD